ncbi:MAG: PRC-barrel domain-containing protein [Acetobacteraceae bacterium]|nr:PRC-barrel domain-containing protein [Acetobacteraceae bacterium]
MTCRFPFLTLALVLAAGPAGAEDTQPADQALIYTGEATSILGRSVDGPAGNVIGRIVDVLVDETGQPRAAVIDMGGFMGVGNRRIAVYWRAMHFQPTAEHGQILLEMTADQLKSVPEYRRASGQPAPPVTMAVPPPK